jgi:hypothetical protein
MVVRMARCLVLATQARKRTTSSGLSTMGSFSGRLGIGMSSSFQGSPQRDLVQEAQRRGDHAQAAGGELAFFEQMDLVGADLLGAERFG